MSEENNVCISPTKKDGDIQDEHQQMEDQTTNPTLDSEESPPVERVGEHIPTVLQQPPVEESTPNDLNLEGNVEPEDLSLPQKQEIPSDAPTEAKSLESDVGKPAKKTPSLIEISPGLIRSAVEKVTDSIQVINDGLKDMKLGDQEVAASPSGKKGRKTPSTPRARSTPVITSPPLTRSRSRDLRKFPSTPSSPGKLSGRKGSEEDADGIRVRGRPRAKKN